MTDRKPLGIFSTAVAAGLGAGLISLAPNYVETLVHKEGITELRMKLNSIEETVNSIDARVKYLVNTSSYNLKTENMIGEPAQEAFYEVNGQRAYVVIDGMPVDQYLQRK